MAFSLIQIEDHVEYLHGKGDSEMYDVFKVLNWLRVKNYKDMQSNDPNVEELTQMKAMKLLYYIQAASLSMTGHRMFDSDIVAWKYGPAIAEVHNVYKRCRGIVNSDNPIDAQAQADYDELQHNKQVLDILEGVYTAYGPMSAYDLMRQTHREDPWRNTKQSQIISDSAIKDFFDGSLEDEKASSVDVNTLQRLFDENKDVMDWLKDK